MLEVYSKGVTVPENVNFPLQTVKVWKGPTSTLSGNVINLNRRGVYRVTVDAVATAATAGVSGIQLYRNGIADPAAETQATVPAAGYAAMGFTAYIQVEDDATPAPGSSPVQIQPIATGADATWDINICVERIV